MKIRIKVVILNFYDKIKKSFLAVIFCFKSKTSKSVLRRRRISFSFSNQLLNHIFLKWFEPYNKKEDFEKNENSKQRKVSQVWNVTTHTQKREREAKKFLNTGTDHLTYLSRKKRKSNFTFFFKQKFSRALFGKFSFKRRF